MSILCIGQAVYDLTFSLEQQIIENQKYRIYDRQECMGAPAANAAFLCSLWGLETSLIARVGNDLFGKQILSSLSSVGTDTSTIHVMDDQPTSVSCIIVNSLNGNRTILNAPLRDSPFEIVWPKNDPDVILVDGHELHISLAALKKYPHAISIIDAGTYKPELSELFQVVDYLVCSEDFAYQYTQLSVDLTDKDQIQNIFSKLSELNPNTIVVTIGDRGSLFKKNNQIQHFPAFTSKVLDTTGAGDIFHGAFAFGLHQKQSLEEIIRLASGASALSVQKIGGQTSIPSLAEVEKRIS